METSTFDLDGNLLIRLEVSTIDWIGSSGKCLVYLPMFIMDTLGTVWRKSLLVSMEVSSNELDGTLMIYMDN
jgi:hypothetical protein